MARSTLELLLDSIKDKDEAPSDAPPALPQRPPSKARLPSAALRMRKMRTVIAAAGALAASVNHANGKDNNGYMLQTPMEGDGHVASPTHYQNGVYTADDAELARFEAESFSRRMAEEQGATEKRKEPEKRLETAASLKGEEDVAGARAEACKPGSYDMEHDLLTSKRKKKRVDRISDLRKDSLVWFLDHTTTKWMLGHIESHAATESMIRSKDGQLITVPFDMLLPANPEILDGVDDLIQLSFVNEPSVSHNLQVRYIQDKIYTKAGAVLIALNSFKEVQTTEASTKAKCHECGPDVFTFADNAIKALMRDGLNQSIILSGESGAGKTDLSNLLVQCLDAAGGDNTLGCAILQANCLLETFGSAKTIHNSNTSRIGKLVDVYFDDFGKLCGAQFHTVLFEKSRVVRRPKGEQSYHIFYQLCEGAGLALKEHLNIMSGEEFEYLKGSKFLESTRIDFKAQFQSLLSTLSGLGIPESDQKTVFSILAAILWLGNIPLNSLNKENGISLTENSEALDIVVRLLKCSKEQLIKALSAEGQQEKAGKGAPGKQLTSKVIDARDVVAESLYERLFEWIVSRVNLSLMNRRRDNSRCISILDMPGFGCFERNGLEQLLINCSNESVQDYIYNSLFQQKHEEYLCEGIIGTSEGISRNPECIPLLETYLFPLLEEECLKESGSASSFIRRVEMELAENNILRTKEGLLFDIRHTNGEVTYDVASILETNWDALSPEVLEILVLSMSHLMEIPNRTEEKALQDNPCVDYHSRSRSNKCKKQVLSIMRRLETSAPHFVFCVRPNMCQIARVYDQKLVVKQLHSCGLLDVVKATKSGYSIHVSQDLFASRFSLLLPYHSGRNNNALEVCIQILRKFNISTYMYQVGLTKLFFRSGQIDQLELARKRLLEAVIFVQRSYRGHKVRSQVRTKRKRVISVQAFARGWLARRSFKQMLKQATKRSSTIYSLADLNVKPTLVSMSNENTEEGKLFIEMPCIDKDFAAYGVDKKEVDPYFEQVKARAIAAEEALLKKEGENMLLQQKLKDYERRWLEYEAKMKSMEEMWQKQITSLEASLAGAIKDVASGEVESQISVKGTPETSQLKKQGLLETTPVHETTITEGAAAAAVRSRSQQQPLSTTNVAKSNELADPSSRSVLDHLTKEFEHRTQIFNDDADFLVEVKSGQTAANFKPDEELRKLKQRFDVWRKDFKVRLRETKGILKKLGKSEIVVKSKKTWWGRNLN